MRIWDINPGYLNRQSLLGEHRELHGMVSIMVNNKKGYSKHPETLRWLKHGWALRQRHQLIAAEMDLRGYNDKSPVELKENPNNWPTTYIDEPTVQFEILKKKYLTKEHGRIPFPKNSQQLWSQHKYSILARSVPLYKKIGVEVAKQHSTKDFHALSKLLTEALRTQPSEGGILNSLQHMWGYVSDQNPVDNDTLQNWNHSQLLQEIQIRVHLIEQPYLLASTALSELMAWIQTQQTTLSLQ